MNLDRCESTHWRLPARLMVLGLAAAALTPPICGCAQQPTDERPSGQTAPDHTNRLARESSPYLLQHAHNPVDWYPWGEEAFAKARRENKLVFLSVGYAACHWCHVMERESFVDPEIAAEMNDRFVCIKVDREERPDVDQIYMTAIQLLSGQGGWPMSVFLTPDGKPFFGGTYFPARDGDRGNATGFLTVLKKVDDVWETKPDLVRQQAETVTTAIRRNQPDRIPAAKGNDVLPGRDEVRLVAESLQTQFDPEFAGFGYSAADPQRPKFPEPSNLLFLLDRAGRQSVPEDERDRARRMLTETLDAMLSGAMWDHLGGGFHRYSVDRRWQIPHFEKMLYDNAQLAVVYSRAYQATGREEYRDVSERIGEFVLRELRAEGGAFYSSLDADSDGEEGKHYRWGPTQLAEVAEQQLSGWSLAESVYRFDEPPNFEDRFHVPAPGASLTEIAARRGLEYRQLDEQIAPARAALLARRQARPRPGIDDKILTAWNGLMIAALAEAGGTLEREEFVAAAADAASFVLNHLRDDRGRLLRSFAGGKAKLNAYLDDYAFLASGLIALHRTTGEDRWLEAARELVDEQIERFWDEGSGGFFFTSDDHPPLIVRLKDPIDSALPAGASVSAENLHDLAELTGEAAYRERLRELLASTQPLFDQAAAGLPRLAITVAETADAESH